VKIVDDYDKLTNKDFGFLQSGNFGVVIMGPVPHSMKGMDEQSMVRSLRKPGFPPIVEMRDKAGNLKSSRDALERAAKQARDMLLEGWDIN